MTHIFCFFLFACITGAQGRTLQEDAFERSKSHYERPSLSPPPSPDASPSDRQTHPNTLIVMVTTNNNNYERGTPFPPPSPQSSTPHHPLFGIDIERKSPSPPPSPKSAPPTNQVSGNRKPPAPPAPKHGPPTHQVSTSGLDRKARSPPPAPQRAPPTNQVSASNQFVASA